MSGITAPNHQANFSDRTLLDLPREEFDWSFPSLIAAVAGALFLSLCLAAQLSLAASVAIASSVVVVVAGTCWLTAIPAYPAPTPYIPAEEARGTTRQIVDLVQVLQRTIRAQSRSIMRLTRDLQAVKQRLGMNQ